MQENENQENEKRKGSDKMKFLKAVTFNAESSKKTLNELGNKTKNSMKKLFSEYYK